MPAEFYGTFRINEGKKSVEITLQSGELDGGKDVFRKLLRMTGRVGDRPLRASLEKIKEITRDPDQRLTVTLCLRLEEDRTEH